MGKSDSTCWTMIRAAAAGGAPERTEFAWRYGPAARAYLIQRWQGSRLTESVDDAVQEVFVQCFKQDGVLESHQRIQEGSFRAFYYSVVRNVARHFETRGSRRREKQAPSQFDFDRIEASEQQLSQAFDRAWARSIIKEAAKELDREARAADEAAMRRVTLLHLRFYEKRSFAAIAREWNEDPEAVRREFDRARNEFRATLRRIVAFHCPNDPAEAERELRRVLEAEASAPFS